jgi:hypothetical protein
MLAKCEYSTVKHYQLQLAVNLLFSRITPFFVISVCAVDCLGFVGDFPAGTPAALQFTQDK